MKYLMQLLFYLAFPWALADIEISNELDHPVTVYAETDCSPTEFFIENMQVPAQSKKTIDSKLIADHTQTACFVIHLTDQHLISVENISDYSECVISISKVNDTIVSSTSNKCHQAKKI